MALSGALADMDVIELLQFPGAGRRSGELVIAAGEQRARLYYAKGRLVHATLGELKGQPVIARVVGWRTGEFAFNGEVAAPETTIEMDVHHVVMQAVKMRDELEEARRRSEGQARAANPGAQALQAFVTATQWALAAALLGPDGAVLARATKPDGGEAPAEPFAGLWAGWPRPGLRRCIVEDEGGTVVAVALPSGRAVVVAADRAAATGVVSMGVGKLAASLEG
ncbi:MAG: DUF4388 domain-containing protein [Anaeromyxobacter sp.]